MVDIATIFTEEIEKNFRNHLPANAVKILILMADQMMTMEKAMNVQQEMIMKLMKFAVLSKEYEAAMLTEKERFDKQFASSMANSEKISES